MRVGITCYPTHGGSGVVATELGKHLAGRGHEVAFIAYSAPLRLAELPPRVSFHEVDIVAYEASATAAPRFGDRRGKKLPCISGGIIDPNRVSVA